MTDLLYIDLFCGAGGTSTGVNTAMLQGDMVDFDDAALAHCRHHKASAMEIIEYYGLDKIQPTDPSNP